MKSYLIVIILFICVGLFAEPRGLSVREVPVSDVVTEQQTPVSQFIIVPEPLQREDLNREEWNPVRELDLGFRLPAGGQYGLKFDNMQSTAVPFGSMGYLLPEGILAVDKAPSWLEIDLAGTLAQLEPARQTVWANLILSTNDPYVDEIAFCIAYSSPQYLNSSYALPELFTENAEFIYSIATQLPYVQVQDTGSAAVGGNYYSTTRYFKKDANGQTMQITVPKELYYWYLVHLKITDEIAAYINPTVVENNSTHNNNIAPPPTGKFWRSYLYNLQEVGYPVLSDTLNQCQTLFNRDGSGNDAIRTIQWWINQNMSFTSNNERPHQPVRIIAKRIGRCGEYADLTSAVARLALIPCTSISSISTDHTWNEFWEENWVSWEPVNGYINNPLVYENGWGKVFGSVFETRSDGLMTPVTDRYSEGYATISTQVVDSTMQPVDGARVVMAILETTNRYDCDQFTDNNGFATFIVGDNRNFRVRVETTFGLYPALAGTYAQLVENSVAGETYQYVLIIPAVMPSPDLELITAPNDPVEDHRFAVSYQSNGYYIGALTLWDDIDVLGSRPMHYKYMPTPSDASFMVMDGDNLLFWQIDHFGSACNYLSPAMNGTSLFNIPTGQDWFAFMDNSHRHRNPVEINGLMIYESYGTEVDDQALVPAALKIVGCYPNPFAEVSIMKVELGEAATMMAAIYNLKGQKVRSFQSQTMMPGQSELVWDGKNDTGHALPSGVYFWKVESGEVNHIRKTVLIRK